MLLESIDVFSDPLDIPALIVGGMVFGTIIAGTNQLINDINQEIERIWNELNNNSHNNSNQNPH